MRSRFSNKSYVDCAGSPPGAGSPGHLVLPPCVSALPPLLLWTADRHFVVGVVAGVLLRPKCCLCSGILGPVLVSGVLAPDSPKSLSGH